MRRTRARPTGRKLESCRGAARQAPVRPGTRKGLLLGGAVAIVLATCAGQQTGQENRPTSGGQEHAQRKLGPPAHLPQAARQLLAERMLNHGSDMSDLLWATLFLDEDSVADIAEHIIQTPRFARPTTQDATELNAALPAEFFDLQDQLVERAEALAEAAQRQAPNEMAEAYGELTKTCVKCHSVYLTEPPEPVTGGESNDGDGVTPE